MYFLARLARYVAALGTFRCVYPVGSPLADLLAVLLVGVDRAFAVALLRHQSSFISSCGLTFNALASLALVLGLIRGLLPVSNAAMVALLTPLIFDNSICVSPRLSLRILTLL